MTGPPLTRLWEDTRITDHMAMPSEEQACSFIYSVFW